MALVYAILLKHTKGMVKIENLDHSAKLLFKGQVHGSAHAH